MDIYQKIGEILEREMHVDPDNHMCDIRAYNAYKEALRFISEIGKDYATQIIVDDPDDTLDLHQIIISWKVKENRYGLKYVDLPERETRALARMMEKANMSEISYDDMTLTLSFQIYLDTATS